MKWLLWKRMKKIDRKVDLVLEQGRLLMTLAEELKAKLAADPALVERLSGNGFVEAPAFVWVVPFHFLFDAMLLVGLWRAGRMGPGGGQ